MDDEFYVENTLMIGGTGGTWFQHSHKVSFSGTAFSSCTSFEHYESSSLSEYSGHTYQSHTVSSNLFDPFGSDEDFITHSPFGTIPMLFPSSYGHNHSWDSWGQMDVFGQSKEETAIKCIERLIPTLMKHGKKLPQYGVEALRDGIAKMGLKKTVMFLFKSIVKYVAGESADEFAGFLLSAVESTSTKLAPKLAVACGAIIGGVGAVAGCLIEIGRFALDIYKKYGQLKGTRNFKREFGRYVAVKTIGLLTTCAGVIGSSVLSTIIGFLIGGPLGGAVGFGVGAVISIAAFIIKKGLEWATGKTYDAILSAMEKESIKY